MKNFWIYYFVIWFVFLPMQLSLFDLLYPQINDPNYWEKANQVHNILSSIQIIHLILVIPLGIKYLKGILDD